MTTAISIHVVITPNLALGISRQIGRVGGLFGIGGEVEVGRWDGGLLLGWVVGYVERRVVVGGKGGALLEADVGEGFQRSLEELV